MSNDASTTIWVDVLGRRHTHRERLGDFVDLTVTCVADDDPFRRRLRLDPGEAGEVAVLGLAERQTRVVELAGVEATVGRAAPDSATGIVRIINGHGIGNRMYSRTTTSRHRLIVRLEP